MAKKVDKFIRQVAQSVLRLPRYLHTSVYYYKVNRLGLESCVSDANNHRLVEALFVLDTPELPVYHLIAERLECAKCRPDLQKIRYATPFAHLNEPEHGQHRPSNMLRHSTHH